MQIKTENTAAESAIDLPSDPYRPDNLLSYHLSLALVDTLVGRGVLSKSDQAKSRRILTRKYGFPAGSIFAEIA